MQGLRFCLAHSHEGRARLHGFRDETLGLALEHDHLSGFKGSRDHTRTQPDEVQLLAVFGLQAYVYAEMLHQRGLRIFGLAELRVTVEAQQMETQ